jgi:DNA repair protein RadC
LPIERTMASASRRLKDALALVDIRVLDHFIVGDGICMSFAERGLL